MISHLIMLMMLLYPQEPQQTCDLDRVSYAVAIQETANCKTGVGRFNNCHGFRVKGEWLKFGSPEESHEYFKRLWKRRYSGGCPTLKDAAKYNSVEGAESWLHGVNKTLYSKT